VAGLHDNSDLENKFKFSRRFYAEWRSGGSLVIGKNKERWRELCEQASAEQNPDKLLELVREINRLLEEKKARIASKTEPQS